MAIGFFWATICLCGFLTFLVLDMMGIFPSKQHFNVDGRTVIVTGGSQGMGRGLGKLLAQKGANVVIVARNKEKLAAALEYISSFAKTSHQRFHSISADLTKSSENTRLIAEVTEWNNNQPPDIVWANAGAAHPTIFVDTDPETMRSQMDTNYWAAAYLAHATLKSWLKPSSSSKSSPGTAVKNVKPRHFIMTSSVGCFVGLAGYGPYSPAKAAMRSLADNLRSEMNLYNGYRKANPSTGPEAEVKIHCIFPGTILSPGLEVENSVKHPVTHLLEEGDTKQTEDEVAAAAIKGLERGGFLISTQMLGEAMRVGMLGGSPRNNWLIDTLFGWVINLAWLYIGPDMERKVWKYGQRHEVNLPE